MYGWSIPPKSKSEAENITGTLVHLPLLLALRTLLGASLERYFIYLHFIFDLIFL